MKILYLCADLGIPVLGHKGASVHVRGLAAALGRAGCSVVVATPLLNKSPWDEPARVPFRIVHVPPTSETAAAASGIKAFSETLGAANSPLCGEVQRILYNKDLSRELKCQFHRDAPDFVYERASLYSTAGVSLAAEFAVPLVLELNAPLTIEQSLYRGSGLAELAAQAERWVVARADAVLTVSALLRDYAVSRGAEPGRVHVLPNGVDPKLFEPRPPDPAIRSRWRLNGGPVVGFVGGLRPWHGVDILPALLERLARRHANVQLVVVGHGPLRADLERELARRGLEHSAVLTGSVPHEEVVGLIRQFDVALAPYSRPQHDFYFSPLKLFEYMACGVPVVATALGQVEEVLRDGQTGLLYPADDLDALTEACDRLLDDRAMRERLGRAAAREVRERYTWDHNAARVLQLARPLAAR